MFPIPGTVAMPAGCTEEIGVEGCAMLGDGEEVVYLCCSDRAAGEADLTGVPVTLEHLSPYPSPRS